MSEFDDHVDAALAALDGLSIRQLEATATALERRKGRSPILGHVFGGVAGARESGWSLSLTRFHLQEAIEKSSDELAERVADAEAAFWRHVRAALSARGSPHKNSGLSVARPESPSSSDLLATDGAPRS